MIDWLNQVFKQASKLHVWRLLNILKLLYLSDKPLDLSEFDRDHVGVCVNELSLFVCNRCPVMLIDPSYLLIVDKIHKGVCERLQIISSTMIEAFQRSYRGSYWGPLKSCFIMGVVNAVPVLVLTSNAKIYHLDLTILYSEVVRFDIFMQKLSF